MASRVSRELSACGLPGTSAVPEVRTLADWEAAIRQAAAQPDGRAPAVVASVLDARRVAGPLDPLEASRARVLAARTGPLGDRVAEAALATRPPLGFAGEAFLEADGTRVQCLDLATRCDRPLVDLARLVAFRAGCVPTATSARLRHAADRAGLEGGLARDLSAAHEWIAGLALRAELDPDRAAGAGTVDARDLDETGRRRLRDVFATLGRAQASLRTGGGRWTS
jgi:CBS domain-containing protein